MNHKKYYLNDKGKNAMTYHLEFTGKLTLKLTLIESNQFKRRKVVLVVKLI